MTEPRLPDPIRSVPPEPGALGAVLATARRRRARRAQAVLGGTAAVLVAVLAVNLTGGGSTQTIGVADGGIGAESEPTPQPTCTAKTDPYSQANVYKCDDDDPTSYPEPDPGATEEPSAEPEPTTSAGGSAGPEPEPSGTATPKPTPSRSQPAGATPTPQPNPSTRPTRSPQPRPQPSGEPSPEARSEMRRSRDTTVAGGMFCEPGFDWCSDASVTGSRPVDLTVRVCRDERAGAGSLSISMAPTDFAVEQGGRELWRWSSGQAFPAMQETIEFGAGDCYEWTTTWRGVDDANRPLPAGRYTLRSSFSSDEVQRSFSDDVTIS